MYDFNDPEDYEEYQEDLLLEQQELEDFAQDNQPDKSWYLEDHSDLY